MPFRICKTIEVESGHMLSKSDSHCSFPHGHTRRIEMILEADRLDDKEMVCDYRAIKMLMEEYLQQFDHSMCANTRDPHFEELKKIYGDRIIAFKDSDPTTEVIARAIYEEADRRLKEHIESNSNALPISANVRIARVRVWETSSSWAEYGE